LCPFGKIFPFCVVLTQEKSGNPDLTLQNKVAVYILVMDLVLKDLTYLGAELEQSYDRELQRQRYKNSHMYNVTRILERFDIKNIFSRL
jgi:hypothetical protein